MHKIDGYVMRTVGGAMFLVMVVVLSLDVIFAFIAELEDTRNEYQTLLHGQFLGADGDPGSRRVAQTHCLVRHEAGIDRGSARRGDR